MSSKKLYECSNLGNIASGDYIPVGDTSDSGVLKKILAPQFSVEVSGGVPVSQYGAVGDFDPANPSAATDNLAALQAAFAENRVVNLGGQSYGVSDTLALTSDAVIISNGGSLHRIPQEEDEGSVFEVLTVSGTRSDYDYTLDSDANEGTNRIECAALASLVSRGTLLKIISDKEYATTVGGATFLYAGEMQTVLTVDGNYIYLSHQLEDTYIAGTEEWQDNARVAIVSPVTLTVIGGLGIYCYPTDDQYYDEDDDAWYGQKTYGMRLVYNINSTGEFHFDGCTRHSLYINSCYAPDIRIYARNSYYYNANNAYGLSIGNSTMYGTFHGVITGCRHCVMTGGANADGGISYGNKFSGQVSGISAEQVLDSHAGTGSMTYENVIVNGGTANYNQTGGPYTAGGIEMGARRNYIRNVVYQGAGPAAVSTRTVSPDIEVFDVDGLQIVGSPQYAVVIGTTDSDTQIERLSLRNIHGSTEYGIRFVGGTVAGDGEITEIDELYIENIHLTGGTWLVVFAGNNTRCKLPDTVKLSNCSLSATSGSDAGIYLASGTAPFNHLILNNCDISGQTCLMDLRSELESVELINVRSTGHSLAHHVNVEYTSLGRIKISGGYYENNAVTALGIVRMDEGGKNLGELIIADCPIFADASYVVSCTNGPEEAPLKATLNGPAYIGPFIGDSIVHLSNNYGAGYKEYLSGCATLPLQMGREFVVAGTVTLATGGISTLNSTDGAITATLPDGKYVGEQKTIIMTNATASSTVSVTHHTTSDPEVFTFADLGDSLILCWNGTDWFTVANNGVTT